MITGGIKSWDSKFTGKVLEVPSKIQGIPVTRIKDFNGSGNKESSLWIPDSVKTIDDKAFDYLTYKSVRLPDGLTYIAEGQFAHSYIKSVTIPSSVKNIYASAFWNSEIESISIPAGCTIHSGYLDIISGTAAFYNCSDLKAVTFPNGRVYFNARPINPQNDDWEEPFTNRGIFKECNSITTVIMPKGFEAVYISKNDFKDYTLSDFFSGEGITRTFALAKSLRDTKVRNAAVVDHEAYLDAYNKSMKSGNYEYAKTFGGAIQTGH